MICTFSTWIFFFLRLLHNSAFRSTLFFFLAAPGSIVWKCYNLHDYCSIQEDFPGLLHLIIDNPIVWVVMDIIANTWDYVPGVFLFIHPLTALVLLRYYYCTFCRWKTTQRLSCCPRSQWTWPSGFKPKKADSTAQIPNECSPWYLWCTVLSWCLFSQVKFSVESLEQERTS